MTDLFTPLEYYPSDDLSSSDSPSDSATAALFLGDLDSELSNFSADPSLTPFLSSSANLSDHAASITAALLKSERECVQQYVGKGQTVRRLRVDLESCDTVLSEMQDMLLGFQADLGGISDEIKHLQVESAAMNVRLRNRKSAEHRVQSFLSHIIIPPAMAESLCNAEVDGNYVANVKLLEEKHKYVNSRDAFDDGSSTDIAPGDTASGKEVAVHVGKLRLKTVAKCRDYFLAKVSEVRRARTNIRVVQVNGLLKYASLMRFLLDAAPDVHDEIRDVYIESMSKTLQNLF